MLQEYAVLVSYSYTVGYLVVKYLTTCYLLYAGLHI